MLAHVSVAVSSQEDMDLSVPKYAISRIRSVERMESIAGSLLAGEGAGPEAVDADDSLLQTTEMEV